MPLQPDQLIGTYILIRQLGRGTFGEVWLARHHDLGELRALKIPTDPHYVQQLRSEGKVIYGLRHENIVRGFDVNTINDPPYVAMEYVEGVTLRQRLRAAGKLPEQEAKDILRQVLSALAYAHQQGVLHRDLKPENILLTRDGGVKVTDFGLGKVQAQVAQSILFSGSLVSADGHNISGTVQYMSPQQQAGEEPDARDDLYSVGIIACELLTGHRPMALGIARTLQRAEVDAAFVPMLEKAVESIRSDRYTTAGEMLQDVNRLAANPLGETMSNPHYVRDLSRVEAAHWDLACVVTSDTVLVVTGAKMGAELFDRPPAEVLRDAIDCEGELDRGRRAVIVSDAIFLQEPSWRDCPHIAVGGPRSNAVCESLSKCLPVKEVLPKGFVAVGRRQAAVWGAGGRQTAEAVRYFIASGLSGFLSQIWQKAE